MEVNIKPPGAFNSLKEQYKTALILGIALICIGLTVVTSIYDYPGVMTDLRNRVVGSRLMRDGFNPYTYVYQPGDPVRYFDSFLNPYSSISPNTSTPFVHWCFWTMSNLPQSAIDKIWFILQWTSAILIFFIFAIRKIPQNRKLLLLGLCTGLILTSGFRIYFLMLQVYLALPLLSIFVFILISGQQSWPKRLMAAGLMLATVLIRPTFIIVWFFVAPIKKIRSTLFFFFTLLVLYTILTLASQMHRNNWKWYFQFLAIKSNNDMPISDEAKSYQPKLYFDYAEGLTLNNPRVYQDMDKVLKPNEISNFFSLYQGWTGKDAPPEYLFFGQVAIALGGFILWIFLFRNKPNEEIAGALLIMGFALFQLFECFTMASKFSYYIVLYFFPLFLIGSLREIKVLDICFMAFGLLLNIIYIDVIPFRATVGQFLLLAGMALPLLRSPMNAMVAGQPADHRGSA